MAARPMRHRTRRYLRYTPSCARIFLAIPRVSLRVTVGLSCLMRGSLTIEKQNIAATEKTAPREKSRMKLSGKGNLSGDPRTSFTM